MPIDKSRGIKYNLFNVKLEDNIPMRKLFAIILAICMLLAVVACDNKVVETDAPSNTEAETESVAATDPESAGGSDTVETEQKNETEESEAESAKATEGDSESASESARATEGNSESASESASETEGKSESASESAIETEDDSESASESAKATEGDSESASESAIETEGNSESASESANETEGNSESASESASETETESETELETSLDPVEMVHPDIDYYIAIEQEEINRTLYFNGKMDGFYSAASMEIGSAARVRLEKNDNGYYVYFIKNGTKIYINVEFIAVLGRVTFDAEAKTVFNFDLSLKTLTFDIDGKTYYLGMYGEQGYFSVSEISYAPESFVSYLIEAACDHQYVGNADGHASLACARCGAAAGEREAHGESYSVSELGKRTTYCSDCGYVVLVELCDGNHWQSDADGHWEGACEICGTAISAKSAHGSLTSDYFTETSYSLGCAICGYAYYTKTVPETMTYMISGYTWGRAATTYYQLNGGNNRGTLTLEDGKAPYGSIVGITTDPANPKPGQILFNRSHSDSSSASSAQQYTFDVGQAKYLVIKIRTNDTAQHMDMAFSTTAKNGIKSVTIPLSRLTAEKWGVIVIDLPATCGEYYAKEAGADSYLVDSLYFTMNGFKATTSIDIEYMAFVEGGFGDIDVLVDEAKAIYVAGSNISEVAIGGSDEDESGDQETEDPTEAETEGETELSGDVTSPDGAKYFIDPEFIKNNAGRQGTHDKTIMVEDGVTFVRIDNFVCAGTTDKWGGLNILNSDVGVTGQYLVMKIRVGKNGLNQTHLSMFIRSAPGNALVAGMQVDVKVAEDGEWHVIVVDLATRVKDAANYFGKDDDGQYHARYLQFRPFTNNQVGAEADDYTDIAYIAFCDELDDLKDIVDETSYEWSVSKTESTLLKVSDHSCARHSAEALQQTSEGGNTVYYSICSTCRNTCYERTVPASVSVYYTASNFATGATTYYNAGKGTVEYDDDNAVVFGREAGNLQVLWHRAQTDIPSSTRSSQTTTMDVGEARFLVIRLRTSNTARTLKLNYSTTAMNSTTGAATVANANGYKADGTKGVEVGDIINLDSGYTTVTFPMASIEEGEWTTFVIDLNAVMGAYHARVEGESSYVVDTFYIDESSAVGNLDVEYMAFVEGDWSDVCALTGAESVINITDRSGAFEVKELS